MNLDFGEDRAVQIDPDQRQTDQDSSTGLSRQSLDKGHKRVHSPVARHRPLSTTAGGGGCGTLEMVGYGDILCALGLSRILPRIHTFCRGKTTLEILGPIESEIHGLVVGAWETLDLGQKVPSWIARLTGMRSLFSGARDL